MQLRGGLNARWAPKPSRTNELAEAGRIHAIAAGINWEAFLVDGRSVASTNRQYAEQKCEYSACYAKEIGAMFVFIRAMKFSRMQKLIPFLSWTAKAEKR
jgi:hypothetical protein